MMMAVPDNIETAGKLPLTGLKVVEVGVWYAGPAAGATLAELGAEVIKVEALQGDQCRLTGKFGPLRTGEFDGEDWTVLYDLANRGKKSVSIDLRKEEGQEILKRIIRDADVFITNLRSASRPGMGIDYETLSAVNPQLIYLSVTGFGREGAMADQGAFDTLAQALTGTMLAIDKDEPQPFSLFLVDQFTGVAGSHAVLTALVARQLQGHGQEIELSLLGAAMWMTQTNLVASAVLKHDVDTSWGRKSNSPLRNTIKTGGNGWIVGTNHPESVNFPIFCRAIGMPELIDDPRFVDDISRNANVHALNEIVEERFLTKSRDEWIDILVNQNGLKFVPILSMTEAMEHEQVIKNGYVSEMVHPVLGPVKLPIHPASFSRSPQVKLEAAPVKIGEDTHEVLARYGYSPVEIQDYSSRRVIRVS